MERMGAEAWECWFNFAELPDPATMEPEDVFGEGYEWGFLAALAFTRSASPTDEEIQAAAIVLWEKGNERLGVQRDREIIGEYIDEAEAALLAAHNTSTGSE